MSAGTSVNPLYPNGRAFITASYSVTDAAMGVEIPTGAIFANITSVATSTFLVWGVSATAVAPTFAGKVAGTSPTVAGYLLPIATSSTAIGAFNIPVSRGGFLWCEGVGGTAAIRGKPARA